MIEIFASKHPAFALVRFCAILKKNTLAAVLISKSHEIFQGLANDWDSSVEAGDKDAKIKKAFDSISDKKAINEIVDKVKKINTVARHVLAKFLLLRLENGDLSSTDSLAFSLTRTLGKNLSILSSWVE